MTDPAIALSNIYKRYGSFEAVNDLSFEVRPGEIYGFLGPNGAGKTTTLRMLLDIIQPSEGRLEILGSPSALPVRGRIGYLPEERGLYRKMKAIDSIAYFAQLRGLDRKTAYARANTLLNDNGLGDFKNAKNTALSKGMAQKVQLLSTITHEPELLILDEPFSGLDPINQQALEDLILDQKKRGRTIIFSTHVMQHAERLCDRFLILAHGRKVFEGTLEEAQKDFSGRVHLRSDIALEVLCSLPEVESADIVGSLNEVAEHSFEVSLAEGFDPQRLLAALVQRGAKISRFEVAGATLHDIFVELASDDKQEPGVEQKFVEAAE